MKNLNFKKFINNRPFFIAEMSANHNGSFEHAKRIIYAAKKYEADAVKLQTYTPDTMTIKSNRNEFKIKKGLWRGNTLWDLYNKAQTPFEWHKKLFAYAKKLKIICFSTPFDETAVDLLEGLNCPFYKVASFEMTDIPLIKKIAKTKKTMIISTGMANLKEIDLTYSIAKKNGAKEIILLYCVSNYPSRISDYNFNNIKILKERYNCIVGFSDHSTDNKVVAAAVAAGAKVIEKHVALDNQKKGFDIAFSLKGKEIRDYKNIISETSIMMGKDFFYRRNSEKLSAQHRRSIYTTQNIKKGEKFTKKNIRVVRPGYGAEPKYFDRIIGKVCQKNIKSEMPLKKKILMQSRIKI